MKKMKSSLLGYVVAFLLFELVGILFVLTHSREEQMQVINLNHTVFFDYFFLFITSTAEVVLPILLLFYFIYRKRELIKPYAVSYALSTLVIQILKHIVFSTALRPLSFFKSSSINWHLVEGLTINEFNSFPSGHTNAAWWMYFWLAYMSPAKMSGFLFGCLAFGVAYSRVYLFQHFPVDTLFGAFFGFSASIIAYYFFVLKKKPNA